MTNKQRDLLCSILFLACGVFVLTQSATIKPIMGKDLGSGFMPKIVAAAMILLSGIKLILTLISKKPAAKLESDDDLLGGLMTIMALSAYVLLFEYLGFILSTGLYLFIQILLLSNEKSRNIKLFAAISVITSVAVYAIFVYVINMPLPAGFIAF